VVTTQLHVKPCKAHLTIGDVSAGQRIGPPRRENRPLPNRRYRQTRPFAHPPPRPGGGVGGGHAGNGIFSS
jgi:hypothetical protein